MREIEIFLRQERSCRFIKLTCSLAERRLPISFMVTWKLHRYTKDIGNLLSVNEYERFSKSTTPLLDEKKNQFFTQFHDIKQISQPSKNIKQTESKYLINLKSPCSDQ